MIEKLEIKEFDAVYAIMEQSFPLEEYRAYDAQRALLENAAYRIYGVREEGQLLGFAAVWELENWLFLEHLAVAPQHRNQGIGAKLLGFLSQNRCCLEVELPETDLARRRIGFYVRNGYVLNRYPYMQPSLGQGRSPVPLWLMTSGGPICPEEFARVKGLLYSRVYGQKE